MNIAGNLRSLDILSRRNGSTIGTIQKQIVGFLRLRNGAVGASIVAIFSSCQVCLIVGRRLFCSRTLSYLGWEIDSKWQCTTCELHCVDVCASNVLVVEYMMSDYLGTWNCSVRELRGRNGAW